MTVPFTAVATGFSNEKIYYTCPGCKERVWVYKAYSAFVGERCFGCQGINEHQFRKQHDPYYK